MEYGYVRWRTPGEIFPTRSWFSASGGQNRAKRSCDVRWMLGSTFNRLSILASNDPRGVVSLIRLSRASYRKMVQNLAWAAGYNVVAIPLAAGALSWAGITLPPAVGAVLMSVSTIVVAVNAQLLRRLDLRRPVLDESVPANA